MIELTEEEAIEVLVQYQALVRSWFGGPSWQFWREA